MTEPTRIALLGDVPEVIPTLARWYKEQWAAWFAGMAMAEIEADFRLLLQSDHLPLGLVAFNTSGQPIGVCSIRSDTFDPYPHAGPWLRGLYVTPDERGKSIAGHLIRAAEQCAAQLPVTKLYAATHSATGTFERAGWLGFDQVLHDGQKLIIFGRQVRQTSSGAPFQQT